MTVLVTRGYGRESESPAQHETFLRDLKGLLQRLDLAVLTISSERPTGGPLKLEIDSDTDPDQITRSFLALATSLAKDHYSRTREADTEIEFELWLPGFSAPISVIGTIY